MDIETESDLIDRDSTEVEQLLKGEETSVHVYHGGQCVFDGDPHRVRISRPRIRDVGGTTQLTFKAEITLRRDADVGDGPEERRVSSVGGAVKPMNDEGDEDPDGVEDDEEDEDDDGDGEDGGKVTFSMTDDPPDW